ncbi:hypothetical protein AB5I41_31070 [Sphingomonas sp. MMS24-JH45]
MVIQYDSTAQVYELFKDNGDWLGAYDTYAEAADARRAALVEAA